ncbi:hypothetical protein ENKO_31660 [Enterobacter kobei]|uniref:Uncharacterized protein n=1 Tax=Enterobacter kobei TaxID=208224 RepID=A0AA86IYZ5_9ENTR|nr:hypothetical protein ENKO_31660 [Enterobacter kobei]
MAIVIITVTTGTAATGATVITGIITINGVKTAGVHTIAAITVAGINAMLTSAAIEKAGAIAMTIVDRVVAMATGMGIIINEY